MMLLHRTFSEIPTLFPSRTNVRTNKRSERIPNTIPTQKGKKPVPGAWKLPMSKRYDSMHIRMEKRSQKEPLHLSDISILPLFYLVILLQTNPNPSPCHQWEYEHQESNSHENSRDGMSKEYSKTSFGDNQRSSKSWLHDRP
jgi:hypothetical protein